MSVTADQVAAAIRDAMIGLVGLPAPAPNPTPPPLSAPKPPKGWITAYYTDWKANLLPISKIEPHVTHLSHAFMVPGMDGTLSGLSQATRKQFCADVHAAGKKAIVSVGGEGTLNGFKASIQNPAFIPNLVTLLADGYDGIDIDYEPLDPSDGPALTAFFKSLRKAAPNAILTVATADNPQIWAPLVPVLDQVNLMAYDLAGPWDGWPVWHEAALHDGGNVFPGTTRPLSSAKQIVDAFVSAGVPASKLGLGLSLNATVWHGPTKPLQSTAGATLNYGVPASQLPSGAYTFDPPTAASYISTGSSFVSYDSPDACKAKAAYARGIGLGGLMVWDIASGLVNGSNPQIQALA